MLLYTAVPSFHGQYSNQFCVYGSVINGFKSGHQTLLYLKFTEQVRLYLLLAEDCKNGKKFPNTPVFFHLYIDVIHLKLPPVL